MTHYTSFLRLYTYTILRSNLAISGSRRTFSSLYFYLLIFFFIFSNIFASYFHLQILDSKVNLFLNFLIISNYTWKLIFRCAILIDFISSQMSKKFVRALWRKKMSCSFNYVWNKFSEAIIKVKLNCDLTN